MAKKASMDTKWKVIGSIIVACIMMGYFGFFFDGCNGEQEHSTNKKEEKFG
jgi:hypothetical protein